LTSDLNIAGPCTNTKAKTKLVKANVLNSIIPTSEKKMSLRNAERAKTRDMLLRIHILKNNGYKNTEDGEGR
jgi:hypothetical protein